MGWQPIETAPKDGRAILMCGPYEETGVVEWNKYHSEFRYQADGSDAIRTQGETWTEYFVFSVPTHWMPVPKAPDT